MVGLDLLFAPPCGYCLKASMTATPSRPVDSRLRGNDGDGTGMTVRDTGMILRRVVAVVTLYGVNRFCKGCDAGMSLWCNVSSISGGSSGASASDGVS